MPEGPEVKRCSEVLRDTIQGKTLTEVRLVSGKLAREGVPNLSSLTYGMNVPYVTSRGKMIFIELQGAWSLVSTLGMSGWWYPNLESISKGDLSDAYYAKVIDTVEKALKYTRLQLVMDDGSIANYIDPRNFGNFYVLSQPDLQAKRKSLGIDYLNDKINMIWKLSYMFCAHDIGHLHRDTANPGEDWKENLPKKYLKMPIGELLLDQSILTGLGNIYRAEVMYLAGICPLSTGCDLRGNELSLIEEAAKYVLRTAYEGRGTMIYKLDDLEYFLPGIKVRRDADPHWKEVIAVNRHLVYGWRTDIFGNPITAEKIGGRTCWWCPTIQDYIAMEKRRVVNI